jgi:hypothetical protein
LGVRSPQGRLGFLQEQFLEVSGESLRGDCSVAAVLVNVIGIVVRYTSYFSPFLVKDLPLNVPDLRNYIADHMQKATNPFVYLANTGGLYLSAEEYQTLVDDIFSTH